MTRQQPRSAQERRRLRHALRLEKPPRCPNCRQNCPRQLVAGIITCASCGAPSPAPPR